MASYDRKYRSDGNLLSVWLSDVKTFNKLFKQDCGMSPSGFRKENGGWLKDLKKKEEY